MFARPQDQARAIGRVTHIMSDFGLAFADVVPLAAVATGAPQPPPMRAMLHLAECPATIRVGSDFQVELVARPVYDSDYSLELSLVQSAARNIEQILDKIPWLEIRAAFVDLAKQFRQLHYADPHYGCIMHYAQKATEQCIFAVHTVLLPSTPRPASASAALETLEAVLPWPPFRQLLRTLYQTVSMDRQASLNEVNFVLINVKTAVEKTCEFIAAVRQGVVPTVSAPPPATAPPALPAAPPAALGAAQPLAMAVPAGMPGAPLSFAPQPQLTQPRPPSQPAASLPPAPAPPPASAPAAAPGATKTPAAPGPATRSPRAEAAAQPATAAAAAAAPGGYMRVGPRAMKGAMLAAAASRAAPTVPAPAPVPASVAAEGPAAAPADPVLDTMLRGIIASNGGGPIDLSRLAQLLHLRHGIYSRNVRPSLKEWLLAHRYSVRNEPTGRVMVTLPSQGPRHARADHAAAAKPVETAVAAAAAAPAATGTPGVSGSTPGVSGSTPGVSGRPAFEQALVDIVRERGGAVRLTELGSLFAQRMGRPLREFTLTTLSKLLPLLGVTVRDSFARLEGGAAAVRSSPQPPLPPAPSIPAPAAGDAAPAAAGSLVGAGPADSAAATVPAVSMTETEIRRVVDDIVREHHGCVPMFKLGGEFLRRTGVALRDVIAPATLSDYVTKLGYLRVNSTVYAPGGQPPRSVAPVVLRTATTTPSSSPADAVPVSEAPAPLSSAPAAADAAENVLDRVPVAAPPAGPDGAAAADRAADASGTLPPLVAPAAALDPLAVAAAALPTPTAAAAAVPVPVLVPPGAVLMAPLPVAVPEPALQASLKPIERPRFDEDDEGDGAGRAGAEPPAAAPSAAASDPAATGPIACPPLPPPPPPSLPSPPRPRTSSPSAAAGPAATEPDAPVE